MQQQLLILWHSCLELLMVVENVRQMKSVRNTTATVMIAFDHVILGSAAVVERLWAVARLS
jgi:hypothetical protein